MRKENAEPFSRQNEGMHHSGEGGGGGVSCSVTPDLGHEKEGAGEKSATTGCCREDWLLLLLLLLLLLPIVCSVVHLLCLKNEIRRF